MTLSPRVWLAGMVVVPLGAVASALFTQHGLDMMPCAWCVLQRLIFLAVAGVALLGLLLPGTRAQRAGAALGLGLALTGVSAALWQHFVASASTSCNQSLADQVMGFTGLDSRFPEVFAAYASCAEAKATLLGLPYEFFSLTLFVLLAFAGWRVALRPA
ncbi:MAG: disulfide bond formation protein B [Aquabacterium sp.]|nr:disulfide bond formation protein B [Aquabacterium sp.]